MATVLEYRGRPITSDDVTTIRTLIAANPQSSRRRLSQQLCEQWGWVQPNGRLRDMVCRSMMLALHRGGHIELPPPRHVPPNPLARRGTRRPATVQVEDSPIVGTLADIGPLVFEQVRRTADESLFDALIESHHYLGYVQPVGEHLKFLVRAGDRPVACFAWSSAPRHLAPRDRFVGWSPEARRRNLRLVAYNSRYLILPWVRVRHLASHLLGRMTRQLADRWQHVYGHPVWFAETFVDPSRFRGTCYRAANWIELGRTTGRGHNDRTNRANRPRKDVLGLPLHRHFRELLSA